MIYNDPQQPDADLPAPLTAALLEAVNAASIAPAVTARVQSRLLQRIRSAPPLTSPAAAITTIADAFITLYGSIRQGDGWVELLPKAHAKLLFTDGKAESYMIRLEPGAW